MDRTRDSEGPVRSAASAEIALLEADLQDFERAEAASRQAAFGWSAVFALALLAFIAYSVTSLGRGGLVFSLLFAVSVGAACCIPPWYEYRTARARTRLRRRELEGLIEGAQPEALPRKVSTGRAQAVSRSSRRT